MGLSQPFIRSVKHTPVARSALEGRAGAVRGPIDAMMLKGAREASLNLATQVSAIGLQPLVQQASGVAPSESPFVRLTSVVLALVNQTGGAPAVDACLRDCREVLKLVHDGLDETGISLDLVFDLERARAMLGRLERLVSVLSDDEARREVAWDRRTTLVSGTAAFMAPERIRSEHEALHQRVTPLAEPPPSQGLLTVLGAMRDAEDADAFIQQVGMPRGGVTPLTQEEFDDLMIWFRVGMPDFDVLFPPSQGIACTPSITSAVATHVTAMATMGWQARNAAAELPMFGCEGDQAGSALMRRQVSKPDHPGISASSRMASATVAGSSWIA